MRRLMRIGLFRRAHQWGRGVPSPLVALALTLIAGGLGGLLGQTSPELQRYCYAMLRSGALLLLIAGAIEVLRHGAQTRQERLEEYTESFRDFRRQLFDCIGWFRIVRKEDWDAACSAVAWPAGLTEGPLSAWRDRIGNRAGEADLKVYEIARRAYQERTALDSAFNRARWEISGIIEKWVGWHNEDDFQEKAAKVVLDNRNILILNAYLEIALAETLKSRDDSVPPWAKFGTLWRQYLGCTESEARRRALQV